MFGRCRTPGRPGQSTVRATRFTGANWLVIITARLGEHSLAAV
jgi:hypothetical protein